jgi:hypothetical protein
MKEIPDAVQGSSDGSVTALGEGKRGRRQELGILTGFFPRSAPTS